MFSGESYEIFQNTLFYRTPPLATSEDKRKARQVPNLKIIFLKELKFTDLCRSLLKTLFFRHNFRSSLIYNTSARHERQERETSNTSATLMTRV